MEMPNYPGTKVRQTVYGNLRGCDFSVDPSLVARNRSPWCPNMIGDRGGNPVKRYGFRALRTMPIPIHNMWHGNLEGVDYIFVSAQANFYATWNNMQQVAGTSAFPAREGYGFQFRHKGKDRLFSSHGGVCKAYDSGGFVTVSNSKTEAYIPTILISRLPSGGGTLYEPVNLLSAKRTESFLGNETDTVYQLSANNLDSSTVVVQEVTASGWVTLTSGYTVNAAAGQVTFSAPHVPLVAGQDNILITYAKTVPGYAERIAGCTVSAAFGVGGHNRIFLTGNPDYKAQDWWSGLNDPTYFPDLNYAVIGTTGTAVMGYQKLGEHLGIVKEENNQDTTIFLRSGSLNSSGEAVFTVRPGTAGAGAISKHCFVNLLDEPLFLSRNGVFATTYAYLSYDRATKNRSFLIDKVLTKSANLQSASACEYMGYYVLTAGGKIYLLDSRRKAGAAGGNDWGYECYHWEHPDVVRVFSYGDNLFIVTGDGKVKKYCSDTEVYNDDGAAIYAAWSTPNDSDGAATYFKTMIKAGCCATVAPFLNTGWTVQLRKDGAPAETIQSMSVSIDPALGPQEVFFRHKEKKYKRLQIILSNGNKNQPFGIHEISKLYTVGRYSKRKRG
jgi:hypothetical protein